MLVEAGILRQVTDPVPNVDAVTDDVHAQDFTAPAGGFKQTQQ